MSASDIDIEQHSIGSPVSEYLSGIIRPPGYWEPDESCEDLKPVGFCENGHVQVAGADPCGTRKCPHHWGQWRKSAAVAIVERLAAYRAAREPGIGRRVAHVVESPPQDKRWTVSRFWEHRSDAHDVGRAAGVRGGVTVPHAYDTNDRADELFEEAIAAGEWEEEMGKWRFVREHTETWEEMQDAIEVRPHFHDVAPVEDLDSGERPDGWVVHNVRSLKPFYVEESEVPGAELVDGAGRIVRDRREVVREGYEDMARLAMYLLSHAAVQPETGDLSRRASVSYWGEVSGAAFDPEEELDRETWETIQKRAAAAVGVAPDVEEEEDGEAAGAECSREECEAIVRPPGELEEYLSDVREYAGWFEDLEREQQWEIWGFWTYLGDRPPPGGAVDVIDGDGEEHDLPPSGFGRNPSVPEGAARDEAALIEWLQSLGRERLDRSPVHAAAAKA